MIVMPSNNTGFECGYLFGKHPGRLGHLHSVDALREPRLGVPWALDNGVFGAFTQGRPWSEEPLYTFIETYAAWKPSWVVVPDSVGNRDETLRLWDTVGICRTGRHDARRRASRCRSCFCGRINIVEMAKSQDLD